MDINQAFPGKHLKAADLNGKRAIVTIDYVEMEDVADSGEKPVVHFQGKDKGLVLNVTNANMIAEICNSTETNEWSGHQIVLYSTKVDFQSRRVDALRVDYPKNKQPPPPPEEEKDEIPF